MKRTILFKGKRVYDSEWVEGFYYSDPENGVFIQDFEYIQDNGNSFDEPPHGYFKRVYAQVHPETVCQFTGLLDKNGNKIFEGDKLKCHEFYSDEPYTTTVRFEDGGFLVDVQGFDYNITCIGFLEDDIELEIIGNTFDNR